MHQEKQYLDIIYEKNKLTPYIVKQPFFKKKYRAKILHFIGNFFLGGSSRLVVDLIENLGDNYEQIVITQKLPKEPAYVNLEIYEYDYPNIESYVKILEKQ
jgi:hypothetical protein